MGCSCRDLLPASIGPAHHLVAAEAMGRQRAGRAMTASGQARAVCRPPEDTLADPPCATEADAVRYIP